MLQSTSLTGLQQVMEERSLQLYNQEERIHQRDNLLTKVKQARNALNFVFYRPDVAHKGLSDEVWQAGRAALFGVDVRTCPHAVSTSMSAFLLATYPHIVSVVY